MGCRQHCLHATFHFIRTESNMSQKTTAAPVMHNRDVKTRKLAKRHLRLANRHTMHPCLPAGLNMKMRMAWDPKPVNMFADNSDNIHEFNDFIMFLCILCDFVFSCSISWYGNMLRGKAGPTSTTQTDGSPFGSTRLTRPRHMPGTCTGC